MPMASINDLADLIAANRTQLERTFDGEILRLKTVYGAAIVDEALQLAQRKGQADPSPAGRAADQPPSCSPKMKRGIAANVLPDESEFKAARGSSFRRVPPSGRRFALGNAGDRACLRCFHR